MAVLNFDTHWDPTEEQLQQAANLDVPDITYADAGPINLDFSGTGSGVSYMPLANTPEPLPFWERATVNLAPLWEGLEKVVQAPQAMVQNIKMIPGNPVGEALGTLGRTIEVSPLGAPLGFLGEAVTAPFNSAGRLVGKIASGDLDPKGQDIFAPYAEGEDIWSRIATNWQLNSETIEDVANIASLIPVGRGLKAANTLMGGSAGRLVKGAFDPDFGDLRDVNPFQWLVGQGPSLAAGSVRATTAEVSGKIIGRAGVALTGLGLVQTTALEHFAPDSEWMQETVNEKIVPEGSIWEVPIDMVLSAGLDIFGLAGVARRAAATSRMTHRATSKMLGEHEAPFLDELLGPDWETHVANGVLSRDSVLTTFRKGIDGAIDDYIIENYNLGRRPELQVTTINEMATIASEEALLKTRQLHFERIITREGYPGLYHRAREHVFGNDIHKGWEDLVSLDVTARITELDEYWKYGPRVFREVPGRLISVNMSPARVAKAALGTLEEGLAAGAEWDDAAKRVFRYKYGPLKVHVGDTIEDTIKNIKKVKFSDKKMTAAEVRANTDVVGVPKPPPIEQGMVRLYRGERDPEWYRDSLSVVQKHVATKNAQQNFLDMIAPKPAPRGAPTELWGDKAFYKFQDETLEQLPKEIRNQRNLGKTLEDAMDIGRGLATKAVGGYTEEKLAVVRKWLFDDSRAADLRAPLNAADKAKTDELVAKYSAAPPMNEALDLVRELTIALARQQTHRARTIFSRLEETIKRGPKAAAREFDESDELDRLFAPPPIDTSKAFWAKEGEDKVGRWFTTDPEVAAKYGGQVYYTDVPAQTVENFRVKDRVKTPEYVLDRKVADSKKLYESKLPGESNGRFKVRTGKTPEDDAPALMTRFGGLVSERTRVARGVVEGKTPNPRLAEIDAELNKIRGSVTKAISDDIDRTEAFIAMREAELEKGVNLPREGVIAARVELETNRARLATLKEEFWDAHTIGTRYQLGYTPKSGTLTPVTPSSTLNIPRGRRTAPGKVLDALFGGIPNRKLQFEAYEKVRAAALATDPDVGKFERAMGQLYTRRREHIKTFAGGYVHSKYASVYHIEPGVKNSIFSEIYGKPPKGHKSWSEVFYRAYPSPSKIAAKQFLGLENNWMKYNETFDWLTRTAYPQFRFYISPRHILMNLGENKFYQLFLGGARGQESLPPEMVRLLDRINNARRNGSEIDDAFLGAGRRLSLEALSKIAASYRPHELAADVMRALDNSPVMQQVMEELGIKDKAGLTKLVHDTMRERDEILGKVGLTTKREKELRTNIDKLEKKQALTPKQRMEIDDELQKAQRELVTVQIEKKQAIVTKELGWKPELNPLVEAQTLYYQDIADRVREMVYGNPSRSAIERVLNSFILYWPISYQLKAGKTLMEFMFSRGFGYKTNTTVGQANIHMQEWHDAKAKEDREYAKFFKDNRQMIFVLKQFFPATPEEMGVSLGPVLRLPVQVMRGYRDPDEAILRLATQGPIYDLSLVEEVIKEQSKPGRILHTAFQGVGEDNKFGRKTFITEK